MDKKPKVCFDCIIGLNFDINNIGKTIFLNREEAEKALKDMRETLNGGKIND